MLARAPSSSIIPDMADDADIDLRAAVNAISDVVQNRPRPLRVFDQIYMKTGDMVLQSELLSGAFQGWAMIVNPFFSPAVQIQTERRHHLILAGPYRLMRHPGYFAMSISVPASALAIGSWIALMPAAGFVLLIKHRAHIEDEFLRNNLPGYVAYARRVGGPYAR